MFIVFEGMDGAGKSTQAKMLLDAIMAPGRKICVSDPGYTDLGKELRKVLLGHADAQPLTQALLFTASRSELAYHIACTEKSSPDGIIISDRWLYSTLVYQCRMGKVDRLTVLQLAEKFCYDVQPDLVFMFDVSPETAMERQHAKRMLESMKSGKPIVADRFESGGLEFFRGLRQAYLDEVELLAAAPFPQLLNMHSGKLHLINADGLPAAVVHATVRQKFLEYVASRDLDIKLYDQ